MELYVVVKSCENYKSIVDIFRDIETGKNEEKRRFCERAEAGICVPLGETERGVRGCVCVWVYVCVCVCLGGGGGVRSDSKKHGEQGSWSEHRDKKEREETPSQTA